MLTFPKVWIRRYRFIKQRPDYGISCCGKAYTVRTWPCFPLLIAPNTLAGLDHRPVCLQNVSITPDGA